MREIKYAVSLDGVSPSNVQFGGMQGEHNATRLNVTIGSELFAKLEGAGYRFEAEDGAGCRQIITMGESVSESIICKIPQSVTCNGGNVTIRLIFSKVDETEIEYILYSFPMKVRFDLTSSGEFTENKEASDVSAAISLAKGYTEKAERFAESAENSAELAVNAREGIEQEIANSLTEAKNSGEFDGADGKDGKDGVDGIDGKDGISATHSWNGTVLTITSASGTSSADLKGEKGDKGDDGMDGKDGADYVLTDDDKSEIATRVNSANVWEKLYEITTDGATKKWEISTFADGDALALTSLGVKIVAKNPVSETPVSAHLTLRGMYVENGSDLLTVMVPLLNIISTTENLVAASTVNNDRGIWFTKFCEAVPNLAGKLSPESYIPSNMFTYDGVQYPIINTVTLSGNGTLAAGNTIEIWGVRK